MQKIVKSLIIFVFIFILGVFFVSLNRSSNYDTEYLIGNKLEIINFKSLKDDKIYTTEDLKKNQFTLINFWASWCAPCRVEHPNLIRLSQEQNLRILGVNFKDKKINALKFLTDLGDPYDFIVSDNKGKQSVNFGIYGIPESVLVNNKLVIIKKFIGPLSKKDLNDIQKIISNL